MKLPRNFLARWLVAFERSRIDNHAMVTEYVARLEEGLEESPSGNSPSPAYQMGQGWRSSPDARKSVWGIVRLVWQERSYLRRVWGSTQPRSVWVVADDRRTGILTGWGDLAEQVQMFGGDAPPRSFVRQDTDAESVVFFSPNLIARRETSTPVLGASLSYLSLFAAPLAFPMRFGAALLGLAQAVPVTAWRHRNTWVTTLLAASIWVLLKRQQPCRLLMMTSNSFVIELLRYLYAISGMGAGVTEVLHGIPTCELEAYHAEMLSAAPEQLSGRLSVIAPVPGLSLAGYPRGVRVEDEVVNLKMNAVRRSRDLRMLAHECVRRAQARDGAWVVALNGAGTVEGKRYLETGCFAFERAILAHIERVSSACGLRLHLQYSLHPAHIKSGEAAEIAAALAPFPVEILEDSFQTWLESDLCISIFSSACWDAHAMGCRVVIGIRPEDKLYSKSLLEAFAYPDAQRTIFDVLTGEIESMPEWNRINPHERLDRVGARVAGYV